MKWYCVSQNHCIHEKIDENDLDGAHVRFLSGQVDSFGQFIRLTEK